MEKVPGNTRNSLAYELEPFEVGILILGFKREISREKKQIEKWENHPKNEGQVTYLEKSESALITLTTSKSRSRC